MRRNFISLSLNPIRLSSTLRCIQSVPFVALSSLSPSHPQRISNYRRRPALKGDEHRPAKAGYGDSECGVLLSHSKILIKGGTVVSAHHQELLGQFGRWLVSSLQLLMVGLRSPVVDGWFKLNIDVVLLTGVRSISTLSTTWCKLPT
ncbi:uncharacterized protein LOC132279426 isoform X2 [Cornus florida]|uniref:uncharacterized protein LOC132279426 isoform X2 n=1 Tax=Cornus florida TaxID=4283 RepID=UPI0028A223EA|nr:uncharacterized protein LOC132279426 isoform X2 [Cornus florida]